MTAFTVIISDENLHGMIAEHFDTFEDAEAFHEETLDKAGTWMEVDGEMVLLNEPDVSIIPTSEVEALGLLNG